MYFKWKYDNRRDVFETLNIKYDSKHLWAMITTYDTVFTTSRA